MQNFASDFQTSRFGGRLRLYLNVYRALTVALASLQTASLDIVEPFSPAIIIISAAVYTVFKFIAPASPRSVPLGQALLGADLLFCASLVWLTGGIDSAYLLYSVSPVLSASFFYGPNTAATMAALSSLNALLAGILNPFYEVSPDPLELSYLLIYIVAVSLSASLPYLVNINLRQRLQGEFVAEERQRLSREIHDGTVQILSAIKWQAQLIDRELGRRGIILPEAGKLIGLVEEARTEALESLELLRRYSGCGQMISQLKNYLHHLKQDSGIDYNMNLPPEEPCLPPHIELQLLRICQEAMNNVRKHADARHITLDITKKNKRFLVTIKDDGNGFEFPVPSGARVSRGHGLNVMRERAESVGGSLVVSSRPGHGTTVTIDVPGDRR